MNSREEIADFIRQKVAAFKAMNLSSVDMDARLIEDIRLIGDDFSEIDYLLTKKYSVQTCDADYHRGMSIKDWADIIFEKSANKQS